MLTIPDRIEMNATDTAADAIFAFENLAIAPDDFDHSAHCQVAWSYLHSYPLWEAIARFDQAIRHYTEAVGAADKYHATITGAMMLLIAQRMDGEESWVEFHAHHGELVADAKGLISRYYSPDLLTDSQAKQRFQLPDRLAE